jgi:hypothetical protein
LTGAPRRAPALRARRHFVGRLGALAAASLALQRPSAAGADGAQRPPLRVGPAQDIKTIAEAAHRAVDGDTIEIDSGDYVGDVAYWRQDRLHIRGVGGPPARLAAGGAHAAGKGIFVVAGDGVTIENLAFRDARVPDRNGAGIRIDRGRLRVIGCEFTHNENGILAGNDPDIEIDIEGSVFRDNGAGDGYTHDLYVGRIGRLAVSSCYFGGARSGHLLKSRARETFVRYSRLSGEDSTSSYELDLPSGGRALLLGNLIQQGPNTENATIVTYGEEGYAWPDNDLLMAFNTIVNDRPQGGIFVAARPGAGRVRLAFDLHVGPGSVQLPREAQQLGVTAAGAADFADAAGFDYRLRRASAVAGRAGAAAAGTADLSLPDREYVHPAKAFVFDAATRARSLSPGAFQRLAPAA